MEGFKGEMRVVCVLVVSSPRECPAWSWCIVLFVPLVRADGFLVRIALECERDSIPDSVGLPSGKADVSRVLAG